MGVALGNQNRRRFTNKTKYHQYGVQNDLFDLVLVKTCGSLTSKKGNQQSIPIRFSDFPSLSANIDKWRFAHGYNSWNIVIPRIRGPSREGLIFHIINPTTPPTPLNDAHQGGYFLEIQILTKLIYTSHCLFNNAFLKLRRHSNVPVQ